MTRGIRYLSLGLLTVALWWGNNSVSFAGSPAEQVKKTIDRVLTVLQDPTIKGESKKAERRERLQQILSARFDFAEMARRSLGIHWKRLNGKQEEFVSVFSDFVENAYLVRLEAFKDEKIVYGRERVDKNFAEVVTKIIPSKGDEISIKYRLHLSKGEWQVYDVVVENVSLVNNYRSQFKRILAKASLDELLRKLREKGSSKES